MATQSQISLNPLSIDKILAAWRDFMDDPRNHLPPFTGKRDDTDMGIFAQRDKIEPLYGETDLEKKLAIAIEEAAYPEKHADTRDTVILLVEAVLALEKKAYGAAQALKKLGSDKEYNFFVFFYKVYEQLKARYDSVTSEDIRMLSTELKDTKNVVLSPWDWRSGKSDIHREKISTLEKSLRSAYADILGSEFVEAYYTFNKMYSIFNLMFSWNWSEQKFEQRNSFYLGYLNPKIESYKKKASDECYIEIFDKHALPETAREVTHVRALIESIDTMLEITRRFIM